MKHKSLMIALCVTLLASTLVADQPLVVDTGKRTEWSIARIKSELAGDVKTITYTTKDGKHTALAVPLVSLLKSAGAATELKHDSKGEPRSKHAELHYAVTVEGRDGYYAVFSLAELIPELANAKTWIVLDDDGKPLSEADGPAKLVVLDDQKPARWVHALAKISLVKVEPPADQ